MKQTIGQRGLDGLVRKEVDRETREADEARQHVQHRSERKQLGVTTPPGWHRWVHRFGKSSGVAQTCHGPGDPIPAMSTARTTAFLLA